MNLGLFSTSGVITLDQNWHHLYSTSAGGKDLSNDAQFSDQPNGALDMHKNAQEVEWKTQSKISCHYTWLLHAKICPSWWCFLRSFLAASKPSRRSITAAKRKEKEKKKGKKKNSKNQKVLRCRSFSCPKTTCISKFWFLRMPESQCGKTRCWWQERQAVVLQTHFRPY